MITAVKIKSPGWHNAIARTALVHTVMPVVLKALKAGQSGIGSLTYDSCRL